MTLSIMTPSIMTTQHNDTHIMTLSIITFSITIKNVKLIMPMKNVTLSITLG